MEEVTGLKEDYCFFAIGFKFITQTQSWVLNDEFRPDRMWHAHPFFISYRRSEKTPEIEREIFDEKYYKSSKNVVSKLNKINQVLH